MQLRVSIRLRVPFPRPVVLDLFEWELNLDEGSLVLVASGVAATDHSNLDCTKFAIVSEG